MDPATLKVERHSYNVYGQEFTIDKNLQLIRDLGRGAYGIVCSASAPNTPGVAIKKLTNIFSRKIFCKRALREIKLLIHFRNQPNITCLYDLDIVNLTDFNEVYLYEELMECNLHQIIKSKQALTDSHYQSFIYQILVGLKYIHSANVLHRDLKPANMLVNADCELKICDFGLARSYGSDSEANPLTEYVATRWYRAPEIMLSFQQYTKAIDVWSVGCILGELLGGRPMFSGDSPHDQLNRILRVVGTPSEAFIQRAGSLRAQEYLQSLPYMPQIPFAQLYPNANPEALDLLSRMLAFDPAERITVEQALEHPYLKVWHDPNDEPVCTETFDFQFEECDDLDEMRQMLIDTVLQFRNEVRQQHRANAIQAHAQVQQPQLHHQAVPSSHDYDVDATPRATTQQW